MDFEWTIYSREREKKKREREKEKKRKREKEKRVECEYKRSEMKDQVSDTSKEIKANHVALILKCESSSTKKKETVNILWIFRPSKSGPGPTIFGFKLGAWNGNDTSLGGHSVCPWRSAQGWHILFLEFEFEALGSFGDSKKIIDAIKAEGILCKRFGIIDAAAEKRRHHGPISDHIRTQS